MAIHRSGTLLTAEEAAKILGVNQKRVRRLSSQGILGRTQDGRRLYITEKSVHEYMRYDRKPGRPFNQKTALAALSMISGMRVPLTAKQRYRLKNTLMNTDVQHLLSLCRKRAEARDFWCRNSRLEDVAAQLRLSSATGDMADDFELTHTDNVEGYIEKSRLEELIAQTYPRDNTSIPNVRVHITECDLSSFGTTMPIGVCAADLAESDDIREHAAGISKLEQLLTEFKQSHEGD